MSLPFRRSLGVEARYTGRREITALVRKLIEIYPNFSFAPDDTRILIETPDKTFTEYVGRGRAAATRRTAHHQFTGYVAAGQFFHRAASPTPAWSKPLGGVHAYKVQRGYGTSNGVTCDLAIYTTNKAALDGKAKLHPGDTTATVCVVRRAVALKTR